jgi:hypothetical protein
MFSLRCPKCRSSRIHHGYSQAPIYKRIFGVQNLLCNGCNLLFTAFAWPGAVKQQSRRKRKNGARHSGAEASPVADAPGLKPPSGDEAETEISATNFNASEEPAAEPMVAETPLTTTSEAIFAARETLRDEAGENASHERRKHEKRPRESVGEGAGVLDYARFGFYYSGLYVKYKLGIRKTTHSMEMAFRWKNWWHWQRNRTP